MLIFLEILSLSEVENGAKSSLTRAEFTLFFLCDFDVSFRSIHTGVKVVKLSTLSRGIQLFLSDRLCTALRLTSSPRRSYLALVTGEA